MADSRSPWFYVLSGCAVLVVVVGVVLVGLAVWGVRTAKEFKADLEDPVRREQRVLETLGAERLPDGWKPVMWFSVPMVFKMAMLTAGEPVVTSEENDVEVGDRMFFFIETIGDRADEARRRFEEGDDIAVLLRDANLNYDIERELDRGTLDVPGGTMLWVAGIAEADLQGTASGKGLGAVGLIDCEADRRSRFVVWVEPIPEGDLDDPAVREATPADPRHLASFLSYFSLCPAS